MLLINVEIRSLFCSYNHSFHTVLTDTESGQKKLLDFSFWHDSTFFGSGDKAPVKSDCQVTESNTTQPVYLRAATSISSVMLNEKTRPVSTVRKKHV